MRKEFNVSHTLNEMYDKLNVPDVKWLPVYLPMGSFMEVQIDYNAGKSGNFEFNYYHIRDAKGKILVEDRNSASFEKLNLKTKLLTELFMRFPYVEERTYASGSIILHLIKIETRGNKQYAESLEEGSYGIYAISLLEIGVNGKEVLRTSSSFLKDFHQVEYLLGMRVINLVKLSMIDSEDIPSLTGYRPEYPTESLNNSMFRGLNPFYSVLFNTKMPWNANIMEGARNATLFVTYTKEFKINSNTELWLISSENVYYNDQAAAQKVSSKVRQLHTEESQ